MKAGLTLTEGQEAGLLSRRQHLSFQQPKHNRRTTGQGRAQLRHHQLHLTDSGISANAVVAKMGRAHTMEPQQEGFRVSKPAC